MRPSIKILGINFFALVLLLFIPGVDKFIPEVAAVIKDITLKTVHTI